MFNPFWGGNNWGPNWGPRFGFGPRWGSPFFHRNMMWNRRWWW